MVSWIIGYTVVVVQVIKVLVSKYYKVLVGKIKYSCMHCKNPKPGKL